MWEFHCEIECAHCGNETTEHFAFNPDEADQSGMLSSVQKIDCWECDKTFYANCYVGFDVRINHSAKKDFSKKKPAKRSKGNE